MWLGRGDSGQKFTDHRRAVEWRMRSVECWRVRNSLGSKALVCATIDHQTWCNLGVRKIMLGEPWHVGKGATQIT